MEQGKWKNGDILVWDGINVGFYEHKTIEEAKQEVMSIIEEDNLIHPDAEMVYIMKVIGVVNITETEKTIVIDDEEVPECDVDIDMYIKPQPISSTTYIAKPEIK
jgi:hypothetical protein